MIGLKAEIRNYELQLSAPLLASFTLISMNTFITLTDIKNGKCDRTIRVLVDGVFDLCHYGHYKLFENVKKALSPHSVHLIAGVHSDEEMENLKRRPIMTMNERITAVKLSPHIDEVLSGAPYNVNSEFVDENQIDLIAHDPNPILLDGSTDMYQ